MTTNQLFAKRDRLKAELAQVERELAERARDYAIENRVWGMTPQMFERAVRAA